VLGRPDRSSLAVEVLPFLKRPNHSKVWLQLMHESPKACFNISNGSLPVLLNLSQNLMHTLCSSTSAIPSISENRRRLMQYTQRHVQQSNAYTGHTHSHRSRKLMNYKRLAYYEHCPGTFEYTFVYCTCCLTVFRVRCKKVVFVNSYMSNNCCV